MSSKRKKKLFHKPGNDLNKSIDSAIEAVDSISDVNTLKTLCKTFVTKYKVANELNSILSGLVDSLDARISALEKHTSKQCNCRNVKTFDSSVKHETAVNAGKNDLEEIKKLKNFDDLVVFVSKTI